MAKKIKFRELEKEGVPLAEVVALQGYFRSPRALPGNVGDSFLYATNPVFRRVRDEFRRRGFRFTLRDDWRYFSFPLMSLDDVIEAGRVPYRDNAFWLGELERRAPGAFSLADVKRSELQLNYLFHESAHFIAHDVLFGGGSLRRLPRNRDVLFRILVGEAFANAVEALSYLHVEGEIGAFFLDANCHYKLDEKEARALSRAVSRLGLRTVAEALVLSFLYANCMYNRLGLREKRAIARHVGAPGSVAALAPVFKNGLLLSDSFRDTTTHFHLVKQGFRDLARLLDFDPLARLARDTALRAQLAELVAVVAG